MWSVPQQGTMCLEIANGVFQPACLQNEDISRAKTGGELGRRHPILSERANAWPHIRTFDWTRREYYPGTVVLSA